MNTQKALISIGFQIRQLRLARGYSQENFANLIGMNRGYYGTIERGETNFTILNLLKIVRGLGILKKDYFPDNFLKNLYTDSFKMTESIL